jgi:uncharacterized protein (DUF983 family)
MALISCPDCKRPVSSLAATCPTCARPIAGDGVPQAPNEPEPSHTPEAQSAEPSLDPGLLARVHRDRVTARTEGVVKVCTECGTDVTGDMFRKKVSGGYVCAECQDEEIDRTVATRTQRSRILWVALVAFLAIVAVFGAMAAVSLVPTSKTPTKH